MNTLSTITIFPDSQGELDHYKANLKNEILTSNTDPLDILKRLKYVEKIISDILEDPDIENHFLSEAYLYEKDKGNATFEHDGCEFSIREVGVKYVYGNSGDVILNDHLKDLKALKAKIEEREKYLKALPDEGAACPINGNILKRPIKLSKTKCVVKLL